MSTIKNPRQKKQLSLERDCRNIFGENSKASRKNIPKAKQRSHMNERRSVAQLLAKVTGQVEQDQASDIEFAVKVEIADCNNWAFEKTPDKPLRVFLERKKLRETRKQRSQRSN
jgi:hypothetical protein